MNKQKIIILGSTGSIGTQTLDVVRSYPDLFEVTTLTANNNWEALVKQAIEFEPDSVVIANKDHYIEVKEALKGKYIKVYAGNEALEQITSYSEADCIVSAMVGFSGLYPTVEGLKSGKKIALANKETLVVAGEHIMKLSAENNAPIIPVDSEHSAIFQSLVGENSKIEKLLLTGSGGPFRLWDKERICKATVKEALAHPSWVMGNKITIDSATLMNKGFEMIEAKWLFDVSPEQIEVVIHPSSVIHSMVQFSDGAIKAQLGVPDMKLPIQYALTFPYRLDMKSERFNFTDGTKFEFFKPDTDKFPCLDLAYEAIRRGGNTPCILNGANEIAVESFLKKEIEFGSIPKIIEYCINKINFVTSPSLESLKEHDSESRILAKEKIKTL